MVNVAPPSFLSLPRRAGKPRSRGITHVLDKGMPVADVAEVLAVAGPYIDIWKLGWGTAYLDPGLEAKLALLADNDVMACTGGTLLEVAWQQGVVEPYLDWACSLGFPGVEVSCGMATMAPGEKQRLVATAAARFVVLAEVGSKDPAAAVAPEAWAAEVTADLAAGATWVVAEGRESGTVGLYDPDGAIRAGLVAAVVEAAGAQRIIFEAPRKDQQAWLIRHYGPDVGLGNITPSEILGMEALRLGLRADTFDATRSRAGGRAALAEITKTTETPLFCGVSSVALLAGPDDTVYLQRPDVDTAVPTAVSRTALRDAPGVRCVVVEGRYGHVSFVLDAEPRRVHVLDVAPPWPAKLVDQVDRVLETGDDLPPVETVAQVVELTDLLPADARGPFLLQCRGGGVEVPGADVSYLDEVPPFRPGWTLLGCARSRQIHDVFYDAPVTQVDTCPRMLAASVELPPGDVLLTKCCLLEEHVECDDRRVVVPWGASFAHLREGLARAVDIADREATGP